LKNECDCGGKIVRRAWLTPSFAILSVCLILLPLREYDWGGWYLNYDLVSYVSFYLGTCFLGLFAWESANAIRKVTTSLLLVVTVGLAITSFIIIILFPFDLNYYGFILTRAPFFLVVLADVVLLWNLALLTNSQRKTHFKLTMIAAFSLIAAVWLLLYIVPDFGYRATNYGQMVSFFILALPTILSWEALMDNNRYEKGESSSNRVKRISAAILISIMAGFFAIVQGSVMWIT
jgi:hypothetical protein